MVIEFLYLNLLAAIIAAAFYVIFLKNNKEEQAESNPSSINPQQVKQAPQKQNQSQVGRPQESISSSLKQPQHVENEDESESSRILHLDEVGQNMIEENSKHIHLKEEQKEIQQQIPEAESSKLNKQGNNEIIILVQDNHDSQSQPNNLNLPINQSKNKECCEHFKVDSVQKSVGKAEISNAQSQQSFRYINSFKTDKIQEQIQKQQNDVAEKQACQQEQKSVDLSGSEIDKLIMEELNESNLNEGLSKTEEKHEFGSINQSRGFEGAIQLKAANSVCQDKSMQSQNEKSFRKLSPQSKDGDLKKYSKRLKNMKNHYKTIIQSLKKKLEDICQRHNQSIGEIDENQTISFSEEESSQFMEQYEGGVQLKVEEVQNLKNQLQIHEEIITNIIQEEQILKDKLRNLQQENNGLKELVMRTSEVQRHNNSRLTQSMLQSRITVEDRAQLGRSSTDKKYTDDLQSKIATLYASQILSSNFSRMNGFSSQIKAGQSTISMMSLYQGIASIGLLGECRFLNEISKKYLLGEIKKHFKEKVCDTSLLFSFTQNQEEQDKLSLFSIMKGMHDILVILKLADGVNVAYFTTSISDLEQEQSKRNESQVLLMNLKSRKSIVLEGLSNYSNNLIQLVEGELGMSEFQPFWLHRNPQIDTFLQTNQESISFISIYQIYFQNK